MNTCDKCIKNPTASTRFQYSVGAKVLEKLFNRNYEPNEFTLRQPDKSTFFLSNWWTSHPYIFDVACYRTAQPNTKATQKRKSSLEVVG